MKNLYFFLILSVVLGACKGVHYRNGVADFNDLQYAYATENFQKALEDGPYKDANLMLAESYYHLNNPQMAAQYYSEAYGNIDFTGSELLHYAQVLRNLDKHDSARIFIQNYIDLYPNDDRAQNMLIATNKMRKLKADTTFSAESINLNQKGYSSFSPVFFEDGILFASERNSGYTEDEISGWTGNPFLSVYFAKTSGNSDSLALDTTFKFPHNSEYHDGPVAYDSARQNLYITRSAYLNSRLNEDSTGVNNFKLYLSRKDSNKWGDLIPLKANVNGASTGHPAVSIDGKHLYFSSDRPGGFGNADLYKATIKEDGTLGEILNLGEEINTSGKEVFPSVVKNSKGDELLYFASNGHVGLGGLDLYYVNLGDSAKKVSHLKQPMNSLHDDFGLVADSGMMSGYFSTNRSTRDHETDEIWQFKKRTFFIKALAVNKQDRKPLDSVKVELEKVDTEEPEMKKKTEEDGIVIFPADYAADYKLVGSKEGYIPARAVVSTFGENEETDTLKVKLVLDKKIQQVGEEAISLDHIFYDFNRYSIRNSAEGDLKNLVKLMKKYQKLEIMLTAHTDCRGTENYNLWLSRKRAESAKSYLVQAGIDKQRIKTEGKGESMLLNNCDCSESSLGKECSEAEHQLNRRTTFRATNLADFEKPVKYEKIDVPQIIDEAPFAN